MAEYNRWMNDRVFEAAAKLDAATLTADNSFPALSALSDFPQPSSLSQPLAPDLASLRHYWRQLDELMERWVAELAPEHLSTNIAYGNMAGVWRRCRRY